MSSQFKLTRTIHCHWISGAAPTQLRRRRRRAPADQNNGSAPGFVCGVSLCYCGGQSGTTRLLVCPTGSHCPHVMRSVIGSQAGGGGKWASSPQSSIHALSQWRQLCNVSSLHMSNHIYMHSWCKETTEKNTRDLAPKAKVLRCHHFKGAGGGGHVSGWVAYQWWE